MKQMNSREKNLGVVIVLVALAMFHQKSDRQRKEEVEGMESLLAGARVRVEQSRSLMAAVPQAVESDRRPAALNDTTMRLLSDVTVPVEIKDVKVISVDHPSPTEFKMVLEGRFGGLMRFLSYLERPEGDFQVKHVDIGVAAPGTPKETDEESTDARALRGTFQLVRRT